LCPTSSALDPGLRFSVSYTTRARRGTEKPGENYVYISREEFLERMQAQEFLEYAEVFDISTAPTAKSSTRPKTKERPDTRH